MKNKKQAKGKPVVISPEAHEIMEKKAIEHRPRRGFRAQINLFLGLPIDK